MNAVTAPFLDKLFASRKLNDIVRKILPNWVTVFMLHRLRTSEGNTVGLDPNYLDRALNYFSENGYRFISIEDAIARADTNSLGNEKWLAFSLDDGFQEQVTTAAPIFKKYDCPSTCFLITGFVDGEVWPWDYQLEYIAQHARAHTIDISVNGTSYPITLGLPQTKRFLRSFVRQVDPNNAYALVKDIASAAQVELPDAPPAHMRATTWADVREMEKLGMQFGAHSVSHRILANLDTESLKQEITHSVQRVRSECNAAANVFCYPSGKAHEFDARAIEIVHQCGLNGALSAEPGYFDPSLLRNSNSYRFVIPRLPFPETFSDLARYVSCAQYVRERLTSNPLKKFL